MHSRRSRQLRHVERLERADRFDGLVLISDFLCPHRRASFTVGIGACATTRVEADSGSLLRLRLLRSYRIYFASHQGHSREDSRENQLMDGNDQGGGGARVRISKQAGDDSAPFGPRPLLRPPWHMASGSRLRSRMRNAATSDTLAAARPANPSKTIRGAPLAMGQHASLQHVQARMLTATGNDR